MSDLVEVYEDRERSPRGEVWYGVRVYGRDRQALWADPDAARRWGEKVVADDAARRGELMETEKPTEEPTLPEETETVERETERETETETEKVVRPVENEENEDGE